MRDKMECAQLVFQDFLDSYEEHLGTNGYWTLGTDGEDDPKTGLTSREWLIGAAILKQKGLIEKLTEDAWKLTDDGEEVCAHPEQLESYLGPRAAALAVQHVQHNTFNAQQMQNVQTGHGSVMNVTYSQVLQQLIREIDASDAPAEKKSVSLPRFR
jgi:hypothetical protein